LLDYAALLTFLMEKNSMRQHAKILGPYNENARKYLSVCGKWLDKEYFKDVATCKRCMDAFSCKMQRISFKEEKKPKQQQKGRQLPQRGKVAESLPIAA